MKRLILEMGIGNDLYGMNYTKAAKRAVENAFRHSTLSIFQSLNLDSNLMDVRVTIGVFDPQHVDCADVAAILPRGKATVRAIKGGHNIEDPNTKGFHIVATAAIEVFYPINSAQWSLCAAPL